MAASPPPAPFGARRDSIIGSLAKIGMVTPRPTTSCVFIAAPDRNRARPVRQLDVFFLEHRADFDVARRQHDLRRRRRGFGRLRPVQQQPVQQQAGDRCDHEREDENPYKSFIH